MLRELFIGGVATGIAYIVGVRAGFDTAVRDYVENDGEMIDRVATKKEKFNYPPGVNNSSEEEKTENDISATFQ